jgi:uncharacterized protein DUF6884
MTHGWLTQGNRLLLLGCSRRKRTDGGLLPALERYDGPTFRVVRKARRHGIPLPMTLVLSAEYGLIPAQQPIPAYDRRMDLERAEELAVDVAPVLRRYLRGFQGQDEVFVCMGKDYLSALLPVLGEVELPLTYANGFIGRQSSLLKRWLLSNEPHAMLSHRGTDPLMLGGQEVKHSAEEVLHLARNQAAKDPMGARRYASWYVTVGELRVAPKWLVGQLTGVPVAKFRTADALRLLTNLAVEVHRA